MKQYDGNKIKSAVVFELLKDCLDKKVTQEVCAETLGLSVRQIKRKCKQLSLNGSREHGNKSRVPINRISDTIRNHIVECCKGSFQGFGPTMVSYEYNRLHNIAIAVETARQIMINNGLWAVKNKPVKRIHPMRERMSCYGELVQADGTEYDWLGDGTKHILLVFIDDATSSLLHAVLVKSESTSSYMQALNDYLLKHGRPMCLYTDKHGVFRVNLPSASESSQTQFARAMEELDIKMIQAHSPQAKGRVERANRTLQDRLAKRFKLNKIKTIEEANKYLQDEYIAEYNKLFAVVPSSPINVHRPLEVAHNLEQILALHNTRIISKNHTVQYNNQVIQILEETNNLHKNEATVITKLDEILGILVSGKAVKFRVMKIHPKQSETVCSKMLNLAVNQVKKNMPQYNAKNIFRHDVNLA